MSTPKTAIAHSKESNQVSIVTDVTDKSQLSAEIAKVKRIGMWVLGLGLGGFILFAAFVPLDEGVPTQGLVSIDTKRKAIQHLQGGIVKEVLVSEGQAVTQNQTLIKLVDEMVRAQYETIRQQFFNLKIIEARLLAEQAGSSVITFDPELTEMALKDKQLNHQFKLQKQLLQARRSSLDSALGALRESSIGQRSIVETSGQIDINRSAQLNSLEKDLVGIRNLVEDGYAPMSKRHELERGVSEIKSSIAENKANQIRAKQAILEIEQRQMSLRADFMKEVEQGLTQIRPDIQSQAEKYKAATQELERTEIKSPVAGQVVGLSVQTVGSVVQAGQRMMEIVPSEEKLVLETKIAPHLIDRVKMGDQVDVRFSSFSDSPQLVVPGVLKTLSSDALTDNTQNAMPYYLARVHVTEEGLKLLGSKKMQPGMPVEIVIKTGSRTLLKYLVSPLTKRIAASMKEQ
jgi:protease secretion system membrane fusion protein